MNKVAKTTLILMIANLVAKVLGFIRELVLASAYGASTYSDVYLVALNIPTVIFSAIGATIATTYIPLYYDNVKNDNHEKGIRFTNNLLNIVLILCFILSLIGLVFTKPLVKLFAMGFEGETLNLTIEFTRILIFGIIFIGAANLIGAYLQLKENYVIPGIMGLPYNIIVIISIILSLKLGYKILAYGTLIAIASQFIFQLPFAYKKNYKYKFIIDIKDENIRKIIYLVGPVFIGVAVNQINTLVDRTLASTLQQGSISALNYANRLNTFVMVLFIMSITSVIYPIISKLSSDNKMKEFCEFITTSINSIIILVMPISIGAIVLSMPIVTILFERGAFTPQATKMTSVALVCYSIGMVSFGLREVLDKIFYSLKDTKTPMKNGIISMLMNIIMNLIIIRYLGYAGLALATSISSIICVYLLLNSLNKKIPYLNKNKIIIVLIKSLIASIIMGILTYIVYSGLYEIIGKGLISNIISVCISVITGIVAYISMIILMKIEEVKYIIETIKNKL